MNLSVALLANLLRAIPAPLATSAYWKLFHKRQTLPIFAPLFSGARLRFANDVRMHLNSFDHMHGMIAFTGVYEVDLSHVIAKRAKKGGLFVDVGANWGYFSLIWAAARPQNRAIAIEASPRNFRSLAHNVEANGFSDRIAWHAVAAGSRSGRQWFNQGPPAETGWGGFCAQPIEATEPAVEVPVKTLVELCRKEDEIAVLKIDVEGAETWVLEGARQLLKERRVREVFFEQNRARMSSLGIGADDARTLLNEYGYTCEPFGSAGDEWRAFHDSSSPSTGSTEFDCLAAPRVLEALHQRARSK
jgi:FkbM family methyltransferase